MNENFINKILPSSYNDVDKNKILNAINKLYIESMDELYIIVNAIKYIYEKEDIFTNDPYRKNMFDGVTTQDFTGLDEEEACLVHYCLVFNAMINKIMQRIIEYYEHSDDLKLIFGEYGKSNTSQYKTLIIVLLCLYKNGDVGNFLKSFCDNTCKLSIDEKNQIDDSEHMSAFNIYKNKLFKLFNNIHSICKRLDYNDYIEAIRKTHIFMYALITLTYVGNKTDRLIPQILYTGVKSINDKINKFLNFVLLVSLYLRDKKRTWFNEKIFNAFIEKHDKIILLLGNYVLCREKFNLFYSILLLYIWGFTEQYENTKLKFSGGFKPLDLEKYIKSNNNAGYFTFNICDSLIRHLVIYIRNNDDRNDYNDTIDENDYNNVNNDKHDDDNDSIAYNNIYIIYDVCADTPDNIHKICYNMDEVVDELKHTTENRKPKYTGTNTTLLFISNFKIFMMLMIILGLILVIIAYNDHKNNNSTSNKTPTTDIDVKKNIINPVK